MMFGSLRVAADGTKGIDMDHVALLLLLLLGALTFGAVAVPVG